MDVFGIHSMFNVALYDLVVNRNYDTIQRITLVFVHVIGD